jgi:hypothetical protein
MTLLCFFLHCRCNDCSARCFGPCSPGRYPSRTSAQAAVLGTKLVCLVAFVGAVSAASRRLSPAMKPAHAAILIISLFCICRCNDCSARCFGACGHGRYPSRTSAHASTLNGLLLLFCVCRCNFTQRAAQGALVSTAMLYFSMVAFFVCCVCVRRCSDCSARCFGPCGPGRYPSHTSAKCETCPRGFACSGSGSPDPNPTPCNSGFYAARQGAKKCRRCPRGQSTPKDNKGYSECK